MTYRLRDYNIGDIDDARRMAAMLNDFDSAWPGGFTRGVAKTPEAVMEYVGRLKRLAILVVERDDEFVGYCDLEAQAGQMEAAYIPLLGARLSHHGHGVGKMLLREMVRRVADRGYRQVTLHTWAGNTKAVPLYKKTGFQWVPETSVFMRNYLPTALTIPAGRAFFAQRDWYACLERELLVAPDDVTWRGMKVYPYRFRDGDDFLSLTFDAAGHGLTALETPGYAVSCVIPVDEALAGEMLPITWEIVSRDGRPLDVMLLASAEEGLKLNVQERFIVRDELTLTRDLFVSPDAAPRRGGETARRVRSTLLIDGQPLVLETGVNVVRPIEILYRGQAIMAGRDQQIKVTLQSRLERPLKGRLVLEAHPDIRCDAPIHEFTLEPRLRTQCAFTISAQRPGAPTTRLRLTAGEMQAERPVSLHVLSGAGAQASVDADYDEKARIENLGLRAEVNLRAGWLELEEPLSGRRLIAQSLLEPGPSSAEDSLIDPLYSVRVEGSGADTALVLTAPSIEFTGLTVERTVTLQGDGLARIDFRLYNGSDQPQQMQLKLKTRPHLEGWLVAPAPQGLIREPLRGWGEFPTGSADLLERGASLTEQWTACEEDGLVCGLIWQGDVKQEYQWHPFPDLRFDPGELPAHSVRALPSLYLFGGRGDWSTVQSLWRRLTQAASAAREPQTPEPVRVLEACFEPSPALLQADREMADVVVFNRRGSELAGRLTLKGDNFQPEPDALEMEGVSRSHPFRARVCIGAPEGPAAGLLQAEVDTGHSVDIFSIPAIRLGSDDALEVVEQEDGLFEVNNGYQKFRVASGFLGSIVALERAGVNHLLSAFPQARPFVWANPWFGGVHPYLGDYMGGDSLTRERFTGQAIRRSGGRGFQWQGVRTVSELQHRERRWLRLETEYLTLPGSNVIALVSRWTNRSTAPVEIEGGMGVWAQLGGARHNAVAHWERAGERRLRRRGGFSIHAAHSPWAAIENPDTHDLLLLVATAARTRVGIEDYAEEGPHLYTHGPVVFEAEEVRERLDWLILCHDPGQIAAYAALAKVTDLP